MENKEIIDWSNHPLGRKGEMYYNRLHKVYKHRSKAAKRIGVSCYRVYDHDLPEFPFCIEIYENHASVAEYLRRHGMDNEQHEAWQLASIELTSDIIGIPIDNIFTRMRKKKANRQDQYEKKDTSQQFITVKENGLKFLVNLSDYLDTGLFLDHRITREMVRKESANKDVLNLFAYTGSFSVYAAAGGANKIDTVDLSKTYLHWAERNMRINGLNKPQNFRFIHTDAVAFMASLKPESYDIIILDPPTFSNSKRMDGIFEVQNDHPTLINQALDALKPGGTVLFSTNSTLFNLETDLINTENIIDITKQTTPFDFEGKLKRWCYKITN